MESSPLVFCIQSSGFYTSSDLSPVVFRFPGKAVLDAASFGPWRTVREPLLFRDKFGEYETFTFFMYLLRVGCRPSYVSAGGISKGQLLPERFRNACRWSAWTHAIRSYSKMEECCVDDTEKSNEESGSESRREEGCNEESCAESRREEGCSEGRCEESCAESRRQESCAESRREKGRAEESRREEGCAESRRQEGLREKSLWLWLQENREKISRFHENPSDNDEKEPGVINSRL